MGYRYKAPYLQSLGHDGAGELLQVHDENEPVPFLLLRQIGRKFEGEHPLQEVEGQLVQVRMAPADLCEGPLQIMPDPGARP